MLIEQIIEFELRGLGPLGRICTPTTGYFHVKIKISKENLRVDYYLLLKYLQNLTQKCKIMNVFWTKLYVKVGLKQFNFFQLAFIR